jgi:hypothetical protein
MVFAEYDTDLNTVFVFEISRVTDFVLDLHNRGSVLSAARF